MDALYWLAPRDRLVRPRHSQKRGAELQDVGSGLGDRGLVSSAAHARSIFSEPSRLQAGGHEPGHGAEPPRDTAHVQQHGGSRSGDFALANAAAGLQGTPPGYTWHHREGVNFPSGFAGTAYCDMFLLPTWYHAGNPHSGGVAEYERAKGVSYRP